MKKMVAIKMVGFKKRDKKELSLWERLLKCTEFREHYAFCRYNLEGIEEVDVIEEFYAHNYDLITYNDSYVDSLYNSNPFFIFKQRS
jgi:hypothetical protein